MRYGPSYWAPNNDPGSELRAKLHLKQLLKDAKRKESDASPKNFIMDCRRDLLYIADPKTSLSFFRISMEPWASRVKRLALLIRHDRLTLDYEPIEHEYTQGYCHGHWDPMTGTAIIRDNYQAEEQTQGPLASFTFDEIWLVVIPRIGRRRGGVDLTDTEAWDELTGVGALKHDRYGFAAFRKWAHATRSYGSAEISGMRVDFRLIEEGLRQYCPFVDGNTKFREAVDSDCWRLRDGVYERQVGRLR